jgi:MarR family transcriptional regulator, transcriptional regulator for hemolysin
MKNIRHENERKLTGGLIRLARVYRKEVNRALSAYGISDAQAVPVLHIARGGGGMRQHQLAEEIGIKGPSLVRLLDQLCAHSLVERRDDGLDRRAKNLHLSAAGAALAERVEAVLTQIRSRLLLGIDDVDLAAALRVIQLLQDALDQGHAAPQTDEAA